MAILSAVVLALAEDWIIQVLNNPTLEMFIWWLPFSVIIGGSYEVIINWANRYKEYKNIALSEILRSGGIAGTQALASLARLGPAGLIAGSIAGYSLATIMLGWRVCYRDRALIFRSITLGRIAGMAREHYHFPVYNLPQALLLTSSRSIPIFLFTFFFDPAVAGLYWFTARIISAPGRLIAGSVGRVFYQKAASKLHRGEEILPHLRSVTLVLSAIGILPVAILWAFGPLLFSVVFGESWYQAGVFAQWVVVAWFFGFISAPSFRLVPICRLQHISLVYNAGLLVCRSIAIPLGAWAGDELTAVSYFALIGATFSFSFMIYIFIKVGKNRPRG
jgi:O-antigen/teichoic acid export membrane protein